MWLKQGDFDFASILLCSSMAFWYINYQLSLFQSITSGEWYSGLTKATFFIWRLFYLSTINKDLVSQGEQAALQTYFVTREYFPSTSGEMWQIVSCHIFWRICDKVPAVVFADGFFLRIPLDWGTMREGQGRAGQSKVTSKIRFLQSRFLHTPWMWFGGDWKDNTKLWCQGSCNNTKYV